MIKNVAAIFALLWAIMCLGGTADAQQTAKVLATCGTASYTAATTNYITIDTTGAACGSGGGGGGSVTQGTSPWVTQETPTTTVSTSALAANLVVSSSANKRLASFEVAADATLSGAAWWVMIYNATSAPADGAVTPAKCYALPSGATSFGAGFPDSSPTFSTGISIGVSTTGCFTKTASTHAFISGDFE